MVNDREYLGPWMDLEAFLFIHAEAHRLLLAASIDAQRDSSAELVLLCCRIHNNKYISELAYIWLPHQQHHSETLIPGMGTSSIHVAAGSSVGLQAWAHAQASQIWRGCCIFQRRRCTAATRTWPFPSALMTLSFLGIDCSCSIHQLSYCGLSKDQSRPSRSRIRTPCMSYDCIPSSSRWAWHTCHWDRSWRWPWSNSNSRFHLNSLVPIT